MAVVMVVATAIIYTLLSRSNTLVKNVSRSLLITNRLKQVLTTATYAEANERGYIITGNEALIKPYLATGQKYPCLFNTSGLAALMPEYKSKLARLDTLAKAKILYINSVAAAMHAGNKQQAAEITNTGRGKILLDSIQNVINDIETAENSKITAAYSDELSDNREIFVLLCGDVAACLALLFIFYVMVLRNGRLREKTEAKLLDAKNLAEAASKAKGNFLALMSHEIRTPMHDIIATGSLLAETGTTLEQQAYANTIHRGCMALLAVVSDIIDFSRMENGAVPVENTPFVLRDCLNEVFLTANAPEHGKKHIYLIDEAIPELIVSDPARLRQVLMCLLGNSAKAIENGEIGVSVRLLASHNDVLTIRFMILNTGMAHFVDQGTPVNGADVGDDALKKNFFGISSLRFSIAVKIISLLGGTIKLSDESNRGNSVTFTITAKKADPFEVENFFARRNKLTGPIDALASNRPLKILVVDDHEMNQVLMVQILAKMGYACKTARNGAEAAGLAVEAKFDIIFMDIIMPVMDGFEAAKRIREYYVNSKTPVIIGVTANALTKDNKKGLEAGMSDFLIKPYKPSDVRQVLSKWAAHVLRPEYDMQDF